MGITQQLPLRQDDSTIKYQHGFRSSANLRDLVNLNGLLTHIHTTTHLTNSYLSQ